MMQDRSSTGASRQREGGYVMAMTALLLVPLMLFSAFAVDVGAWYLEAQQAQRAADAAALAGVVWMPNFPVAEQVAVDAARRNGFEEPGGFATGIQPSFPQIEVVPLGNQQLQVTIHTEEASYFAAPVVAGIEIERRASAEYSLPVPLGNPTNSLGTADLDLGGASPPAGYYLNAHATGMGVSAGDLLNSGNSPLYDATGPGYVYVVNKPIGVTADLFVEVFHGGRCKRNDPLTWQEQGWGQNRGEQHFRSNGSVRNTPDLNLVLFPADNTPLSDTDNFSLPPIAATDGNTVFVPADTECPVYDDGSGDPSDTGEVLDANWLSAFRIPGAAQSGRYYLSVRTPDGSTGHKNMYGLRVRANGGAAFCSSLTASSCPTINALDRMSVYIGENTRTPNAGVSQADFFFAEIDAVHEGKEMELLIWDAAEGSEFMQFLDPFGNPLPFSWETVNRQTTYGWTTPFGAGPDVTGSGGAEVTTCPFGAALTNTSTGTRPCLDVTQIPGDSSNPFHDRMIRVVIDLTGYTCNGTDCWWRIYYRSTGAVDDTTTWSVNIIGDPVRLID